MTEPPTPPQHGDVYFSWTREIRPARKGEWHCGGTRWYEAELISKWNGVQPTTDDRSILKRWVWNGIEGRWENNE